MLLHSTSVTKLIYLLGSSNGNTISVILELFFLEAKTKN